MLSGYLTAKKVGGSPGFAYFVKRIWQLCAILLGSSLLYATWSYFAYHERCTAYQFISKTLTGRAYYHLWYLSVILKFYFLAPVVHPFLNQITHRKFFYIFLVWLVIVSIPVTLWRRADQEFSVGIYTLLGLLGYYSFGAAIGYLNHIQGRFKVVLCLFALVIMSFAYMYAPGDKHGLLESTLGYFSPFVCVLAGATFVCLSAVRLDHSARYPIATSIVRVVSGGALLVYVLHPIVIDLTFRMLEASEPSWAVCILVSGVAFTVPLGIYMLGVFATQRIKTARDPSKVVA